MKLVKGISGIIAVLFSIQPLATWAASPVQKDAKAVPKSAPVVIKIQSDKSDRTRSGPPICPGG